MHSGYLGCSGGGDVQKRGCNGRYGNQHGRYDADERVRQGAEGKRLWLTAHLRCLSGNISAGCLNTMSMLTYLHSLD